MPLKKELGKIHLWLGLASGLVVFVVSMTGAIWCWEEELQDVFLPYRSLERQDASFLLPSQLMESAKLFFKERTVQSIEYRGADKSAVLYHWGEKGTYKAYVDPYTGDLLKTSEGSGFFDIVLDLHMHLMLGEVGGQIVSYGTLIFVLMLITGIVLWWPKNKKARKQRTWFRWKSTTRWKRKNYDLHNILGFYSSFILIFIALTGLAWSFEWMDRSLQFVVSGGQEFQPWPDHHIKSDSTLEAPQNMIDQIYLKAIDHYGKPYARLGFWIPGDGEHPINFWINPSSITWYNAHNMYFHPQTGELVGEHSFQDSPVGLKANMLYYDIHIGKIGGLTGQVIAFFASLFSASLPVTGFIIWYGRNKKKRKLKKKNQSGVLTISSNNRQIKRKPPVIKAKNKNGVPALTVKSATDDY